MQSLSEKTSCLSCQQLLVDTPKVLPGCLHVFCLPCLNTFPLALETDGRSSTGDSKGCSQSATCEPQVCCPEGWAERGDAAMPGELQKERLSDEVGGRWDEGSVVPSLEDPNSSCTAEPPSYPEPSKQASASSIPDFTLSVRCPKCSRSSFLPPEGFEGLRTSYVVSNMATTHRAFRDLQENLPERKCGQCVDGKTTAAISYCCTCRQLICEDHTKCHKMWREFSSHRFFPVESFSLGSEGCLDSGAIKLLTPSLNLGEVKCSRHSQKMDNHHKFFCCTCEDLACSYCIVSKHKDGQDHSCVSITPDLVSEKKQSVAKSLEQLNGLMDDLDILAGNVQSQQENIAQKASDLKDRVDAVFAEVIDTLRSRRLSLCDEVDIGVNDSIKILQDCTKKINTLKQQVKESQDFVQDNLQSDGDLGLLSVAGVISDCSSNMCEEYKQLLPGCKVHAPDLEFMEDRDQLYSRIAAFGSILTHPSSSPAPRQYRSKSATVISLYERLHKIKNLTLTHTLRETALVESTADIFNANLMDSLTGSYVFPPPTSGCSSSRGGVDETAICPVMIEFPKFSGIYVRTVEGLDGPSGIRVDRNFRLIVCEFGPHQVTTLDPSGRVVSRLGREGVKRGQFLFPQSSACDAEGKMLVVDSMYRMQLFDRNGRFLKCVGTKGKAPLQFMDPVSVAISQDKRVFICERENHRIQVLDREFSFLAFLGKPGRKECEFYLPSDITLSDAGRLFVADSGNHRIQVLTLDGDFLQSFGRKGSEVGELYLPSHICIDSYGVYVTEEGNHRVSVFTRSGIFIRTIGEKGSLLGQFLRPLGVAIDENKTLYVCDSRNKRIQIFK